MSETTDYEAYKEESVTILLQQEMLSGDYFGRETNEEVHTWEKYTFTGNENWVKATEGNMFYWTGNDVPSYNLSDLNVLCNCAKGIADNTVTNANQAFNKIKDNQVILRNHETRAIYFRYDNITTANEFKTQIAGKYIYYKTSEETRLAMTEEQIKAFEQLDKFKTHKNITDITTDSIAILDVDYKKDLEKIISEDKQEVVLYENETGTNGDVTIENLNTYKRLKIIFCGKGAAPGSIYSSQEVEVKNGSYFEIGTTHKDNTQNVIFIKTKLMSISTTENKLKVVSYGNWNSFEGVAEQHSNDVYITKIIAL